MSNTIMVGRNGANIQCKHCGKEIDKPKYILKFNDDYFCDVDCLGEYLVAQVEDEVEVVWADTEENIKICMGE